MKNEGQTHVFFRLKWGFASVYVLCFEGTRFRLVEQKSKRKPAICVVLLF